MAYKATGIRLDPETRSTLEGWLRASSTEQRYVKRARIVLLAADGMASRAIAREVGQGVDSDTARSLKDKISAGLA
jgi:hypothetical protein